MNKCKCKNRLTNVLKTNCGFFCNKCGFLIDVKQGDIITIHPIKDSSWEEMYNMIPLPEQDCSFEEFNCYRDRIKSFIRDLIKSEREEIRKGVEGMKKYIQDRGRTEEDLNDYNTALNDVLSILIQKE